MTVLGRRRFINMLIFAIALVLAQVFGTSGVASAASASTSAATPFPGQVVSVTWVGISPAKAGDWVAFARVGSPNGTYLDWFFVTNSGLCSKTNQIVLATGSCSFRIPANSVGGRYEFRVFASGGSTLLASTNIITIPTMTPNLSVAPALGAVTVTFSDLPSPVAGDWLRLMLVGAIDNAADFGWVYTSSCTRGGATAVASGSCTMTMPATGGIYEFRVYSSGTFNKRASSTPFKVLAPLLSAGPSIISPGRTVDIEYSSLFNPIAGDWIGIFAVGASDTATYGDWTYTNCSKTAPAAVASNRCSLTMPSSGGKYELRIYASGSRTRRATSGVVTVTTPTPTPVPVVTIGATPANLVGGAKATVKFYGLPAPQAGDWIGIFTVGAPDSGSYSNWIYTSCSQTAPTAANANTCLMTMPSVAGRYEFRIFAANSLTKRGTSNVVTVLPPA